MNGHQRLEKIRGLILDMDGILWRGDQVIEGAPDFLDELERRKVPHMFVTNNSTSTPEEISEKANRIGIPIPPTLVLTSSQATGRMLQDTWPPGTKMFTIGESGLRTALLESGFELVSSAEGAQIVVVGLDRQVDWSALSEAAYAIESGAEFVGTNPDRSLPTERGLAPGNGAILAAIQDTTGIKPKVVGKPEPSLFKYAAEILDLPADRMLVVGDRLETDISGGQHAGMVCALVLTGASQRSDLKDSPVVPDYVFRNLAELSSALWGPSG